MTGKVALITGITGQDGAYLAEFLLAKGYVVFRGALRFDTSRPDGTPQKLLDVSRLSKLGWKARTPLKDGIGLAYRDFLGRMHKVPA